MDCWVCFPLGSASRWRHLSWSLLLTPVPYWLIFMWIFKGWMVQQLLVWLLTNIVIITLSWVVPCMWMFSGFLFSVREVPKEPFCPHITSSGPTYLPHHLLISGKPPIFNSPTCPLSTIVLPTHQSCFSRILQKRKKNILSLVPANTPSILQISCSFSTPVSCLLSVILSF